MKYKFILFSPWLLKSPVENPAVESPEAPSSPGATAATNSPCCPSFGCLGFGV